MAKDHDTLAVPKLEGRTRVLIVRSPYYSAIAGDLLKGAEKALKAAGVQSELVDVPGALEIPTAIALAAKSGRYDGFVVEACRRDTHNLRSEASNGVSDTARTNRGCVHVSVGI